MDESRFTWNATESAARLFHVKLAASESDAIYLIAFHVKPSAAGFSSGQALGGWKPPPRLESFQRIDDQSAEQLRIEVGALGGHPFPMLADAADVLNGRRHDKGRERELAGFETFDDLVD